MKRRLLIPWAGAAGAALIVVFAGCAAFTNMRGNTQYGADQRLKGQVDDALKADPLYKFPNVGVSAYRSEVQLSGVVHSEDQKKEAVKDATAVPGVLAVSDHIMVNTNPPVAPVQ